MRAQCLKTPWLYLVLPCVLTLPPAPPAFSAAFGPDNFGYTADLIIPNLRNISTTGTPLTLGDDEISSSIPIPFAFNFYGTDVHETFVSSNGFLVFMSDAGTGCCAGGFVPSTTSPNFLIAGLWEDLNPTQGGTIRHQVNGISPNRELVIGFYNIYYFSNPPVAPNVTFEIILHESTNRIELQYGDAPADTVSPNGTTIAIENKDGTDGLEIAHGTNLILSNSAYTINHPCPTRLSGDFNFDCKNNLLDLIIYTQTWLTNCLKTPTHPNCTP